MSFEMETKIAVLHEQAHKQTNILETSILEVPKAIQMTLKNKNIFYQKS